MAIRCFFLACLTCTYLVTAVHAADWPHWRGPNRDDISSESSGWDNGKWPMRQLWQRNFGEGSTSPIVVDGKLYTLGWSGNRDTVYCADASTGKDIWKQVYSCPRFGRVAIGDQGQYSGPTATPEYDAKTRYLYTLSIDGDLYCWDTSKKGQKVWHVNLYKNYRVARRPNVGRSRRMLRDYGYTTAPLVHEDWVLVEAGAKAGTIIAFDKRTGRQQWTSEAKEEAGHSGGLVPITVEGVPCVAVLTLRHLLVIRLDMENAGKTVAKYKWTTDYGNNIATPAVEKNFVVITSSYNHAAICKLRITLKGAVREWETPRLASGVCSPIIYKGHVYWAWRGVHCVDFETGKEKWSGGSVGSTGSCILTADERLIVWCNRGDLMLTEIAVRSPKRYMELAKQRVLSRTSAWPHVVLADGKLFCRDRSGVVICFQLTASK